MEIQYFSQAVKYLKEQKYITTLKDLAAKLDAGYTYLSELNAGSKPTTQEIIDKVNAKFKTKFVFKAPSELNQIDVSEYMEIPVITVNAQAGYLNSILENDNEFVNDLDTMLIPKEFDPGYYLIFEVNGDSMDDGSRRSICDGDRLLCNELQKQYWTQRLYYRQYLFVIVSHDGIVCKQVIDHDVQNGIITCRSFNQHFEDYQVSLADVHKLYYVKKILDRKVKF